MIAAAPKLFHTSHHYGISLITHNSYIHMPLLLTINFFMIVTLTSLLPQQPVS